MGFIDVVFLEPKVVHVYLLEINWVVEVSEIRVEEEMSNVAL